MEDEREQFLHKSRQVTSNDGGGDARRYEYGDVR